MNQKLPYFLFLFLCFSLNTLLNAQTQNDSLAKYSYEELKDLIYNTELTNRELSKFYIDEYYKRAKQEVSVIRTSIAYYYLSYYHSAVDLDLAIKYTDSVIDICKDCRHRLHPAIGYYGKGILNYRKGNNKEAFKNYILALDVLKVNKNIQLEIDLRSAIMSLKSNWLSDEETLEFSLKHLDFIINNKEAIHDFEETLFIALYNLSSRYIRSKRYIKSLEISKSGIKESLIYKDTSMYYEFVSNSGIALYYLKNYNASIDSLKKALPYKSDHGKAMSNYYLGKSYNKLKQPEKAHFHFLKTDSIYQATKDIFPEMRIAYEHIIDYYKSKNDAENQIKYYDRLLETDKIIDSTYTYVTETIEKKYETPQVIAERARLVEELEAKKNAWKYSFGIISAILLAVIGFLVVVFRRQRYYKKRFESLMNISTPLNVQKTNPEVTETSISMVSAEALEAREGKKDLGVPQEIIETILSQLKKFESSQKFTKQVSITSLAKNLKTNPKYLSKVINWHYQKNFSHYISELRIEYVISKLKEDSKFRNYTIKAIAEEAGFGNTESFSKAFHKSTGIKPSYFIKELHKRFES